MAQLSFEMNFPTPPTNGVVAPQQGSLSFSPLQVRDNISLLTLNFAVINFRQHSVTASFGLYSLNAGTALSLANYITNTRTVGSANLGRYVSLTATSSAQNITPGTWWWGIWLSTASQSTGNTFNLGGQSVNAGGNAFPGAFIGGRMTESTAALPVSVATSALDVTGADALSVVSIILSA